MKKYFLILFIIFPINAFAYWTETITNQCGIIDNNIRAVFVPNQHTCSAGYFLPANVDGCRPCPNDYVCNGGTFSFNEIQSQGIVYKQPTRQNIPNGCATNMPHDMVAVFTPNVININWTGATAAAISANNAGTVTYDSDIRTPQSAITVPGKRFTGWRFSAPTPVSANPEPSGN